MINPMFKAMQPKKKRPVDPDAPPRPNLLTHEVKLRTAQQVIEQMESHVQRLTARVTELERKLSKQTDYLSAVHQSLQSRKR